MPGATSVDPADPASAENAASLELALLEVDGHRFAIDISWIREVVPPRPVTPLPGSEPHVVGVMNLHGRIVTVVDLGIRLGLSGAATVPEHSVAVIEHGDRLIGVAVHGIVHIVRTDAASLDASIEALRGARFEREYLRGIGETNGRPYFAIDPDAMFASTFA